LLRASWTSGRQAAGVCNLASLLRAFLAIRLDERKHGVDRASIGTPYVTSVFLLLGLPELRLPGLDGLVGLLKMLLAHLQVRGTINIGTNERLTSDTSTHAPRDRSPLCSRPLWRGRACAVPR
jgi:hypothetical protein